MFGGYVPINDPFIHHASPRMKYTFTKSPLPGMKFSWKIIKDYIYFEHNLTKLNAWYGIGISGAEPHGMGFSDFMISMHNRNYTGIFDLYKYDAGPGYPCWDVLYECSVGNKTKGKLNLENRTITRENGITSSIWSRKLNTGDSKDWPIVKGDMTVLFAYGVDDYFTYHQNRIMCQLNFYTGKSTCNSYDELSNTSSTKEK